MNDTTLAQQMVAAIPVATRNVSLSTGPKLRQKLHSGVGVGMARAARFILGQKDIRDCVPSLINRENVL